MEEPPRPRRRRPRGGRGRRGGAPRPNQAPAQPERPTAPRGDRSSPPDRRTPSRDRGPSSRERGIAPRERGIAPRDRADGGRGRTRRGGRGRAPRSPDDVRPGTACVILLDCREGEPDRSGSPAVFEGFFDLETGDPRRAGTGVPRLRVEEERLWGFECWWRVDTEKTGLTDTDREELETSKRLLRGLLRDRTRSSRAIR